MLENDDVFDAMGDRRRRELLVDLLDGSPHHLSELSAVSRELLEGHESLLDEFLSTPREIDDADEALVRAHHLHLPKLVEYNFVEWDRERRVVRKGERFDEVKPVLDVLVDQSEESHAGDSLVTVRR